MSFIYDLFVIFLELMIAAAYIGIFAVLPLLILAKIDRYLARRRTKRRRQTLERKHRILLMTAEHRKHERR